MAWHVQVSCVCAAALLADPSAGDAAAAGVGLVLYESMPVMLCTLLLVLAVLNTYHLSMSCGDLSASAICKPAKYQKKPRQAS
jgi:hypothetical protein